MDLSTLWPIAVAVASGAAAWGANRVEVTRLKADVGKLIDANVSLRIAALEKSAERHDDVRDEVMALKSDVRHMLEKLGRIERAILKDAAIV